MCRLFAYVFVPCGSDFVFVVFSLMREGRFESSSERISLGSCKTFCLGQKSDSQLNYFMWHCWNRPSFSLFLIDSPIIEIFMCLTLMEWKLFHSKTEIQVRWLLCSFFNLWRIRIRGIINKNIIQFDITPVSNWWASSRNEPFTFYRSCFVVAVLFISGHSGIYALNQINKSLSLLWLRGMFSSQYVIDGIAY